MLSSLLGGGKPKPDEESGFGANRFAEKQQTLDDLKSNGFDSGEFLTEASKMFESAIENSRKTMAAIKEGVTPEFFNRIMNARTYKTQVETSDTFIGESVTKVEEAIKNEYTQFQVERKLNERRKNELEKKKAGEEKQRITLEKDRNRKRAALRVNYYQIIRICSFFDSKC